MSYIIEIDRFRIVLHLLRCFMHLSIPFMVMPSEIWPFVSIYNHSEVYDGYVFLVHVGVMEAFFILNGFFAIQMLRNKTVKQFIVNRLRRILVPFFIGMVTIIPFILIISLSYRHNIAINNFSIKLLIDHYKLNPYNFGHLWSLWYLLIIYAILLLFESRDHFISNQIKKLSFVQISLITITMSAFALFCFNRKYTLLPVDSLLDWQMVLYYLSFFCLGIWFYERKAEISLMKMNNVIYFITPFTILINVIYQKYDSQNLLFHFFGKLGYVTQAFCITFILFSLIRYKKIGGEKRIKNISQNMYWLYWIEVPIAIVIHYCFINSIYPSLIVVGGGFFTLIASLITYNLLLKNNILGKTLGFSI